MVGCGFLGSKDLLARMSADECHARASVPPQHGHPVHTISEEVGLTPEPLLSLLRNRGNSDSIASRATNASRPSASPSAELTVMAHCDGEMARVGIAALARVSGHVAVELWRASRAPLLV